jgi:Putative beta barrel porin-7 (BBP7)
MSRLRITALALSLGLLAAKAPADEVQPWGPASHTAAPATAAQLGRPVASQTPAANPSAPALLERPRPVSDGRAASPSQPSPETGGEQGGGDGQVRPVQFAPVFRGEMGDAKPLPAGPAASGDAALMPHNWQRPSPDQGIVPAPEAPEGPALDGACGDGGGACCGRGPLRSMFGWLGGLGWCGCKGAACEGGCEGACDGGVDGDCGACGGGAWGRGCCPPGNRFYASAEYLLWSTKGERLPPLVTAGSAGDLASGANVGALGLPGTAVLFGGDDVNERARSGGRLMVGYWFGDQHALGIEGGGFFLGRQTSSFTTSSNGTPILARPFFNAATGLQDSELVAAPGILAGTVTARTSNTFYGAEANLRSNVLCGPCWNVDLIAGYRYLALDEDLTIGESLQALQVPLTFALNDSFRVHNRFNGGQVGFESEWRRNRWSLDLKAKVALGNESERVDIFGSTVTNGVAAPRGLLAQPSNSGSFSRNRFAVSPDVGVNIGYQVTNHMRAFVGYDYLYLSDVVRAGDQVDFRVNPNQLRGVTAGPAQPAFNFHGTDFWAQGVSFGLEFKY